MNNVVPFKQSIPRRPCKNFKRKSTSYKGNSRHLSQSVKQIVGAANVFQQLAIENRYGLEMLERLGREILAETRARVARQRAE